MTNVERNTHNQASKNNRNRVNDTKGTACLSVVQINLHKDKRAWPNLVSYIIGKKLPVILAQEPYTKPNNRIPSVHKDLIAFYHRSDERPRASIHVHKKLKDSTWELSQFTTKDLVAIKIRTERNKELILASAYMDGSGNFPCPPNDIKPLVSFAKQQNLPLIIGSDVNARHFLWGNTDANNRGEELLDYLTSEDLTWSNFGSAPTFDNNRWQSIIDLTIVNKLGESMVRNWHVSSEPSLSDHKFIFFDVQHLIKVAEPKRLSKNTNWEEYNKLLSTDENLKDITRNPPDSPITLDIAANKLKRSITAAYEASCPVTYIPNSLKDPPWLTREIKEARGEMRSKLMKARASKLTKDWKAYRLQAASYKKNLTKTKRQSWKNFVADTDSVDAKARLTKILKADSSKQTHIQSVYREDGSITKTPTETLERLTEVHFGPTDLNAPTPDDQPEVTVETDDTTTNRVYSEDRLRRAMKLFAPNKAPGLDGIQPILIQQGWEHLHEPISTIMRISHKLGHVPACWRESKGIFLPKPGKPDYLQPKAYRVITLTPTLLKLQERAILWHMQEDLKMNTLISERQYGFKRGSSTTTALHKVVHRIEKAISSKGFALGAFLDIEGAFDNLTFKAIREALVKCKLDDTITKWIMDMICNRYVTVEVKNHQKRIKIQRGCPQGGILSPFLWNLVINDLLKHAQENNIGNLQAFADDLLSLVAGSDTGTIRDITQRTLRVIEEWCQARGLKVSVLKTKLVMFTWNTKWKLSKAIKLDGVPLQLSQTVKFLGITLDHKLCFKQHITNITKKATTILMQCRQAVGPTWGMTPQTCRWIYTAVVRPILTYGVTTWVRGLNTQENQQLLGRVQRRALIMATGALPSTANITLNKLNNLPHIVDYLGGEAVNNALRLDAYGDWTKEILPNLRGTILAHATIIDKGIKKLELPKGEYDLMKPRLTLDRNFSAEIPDRVNLESIIEKHKNSLTCYTDGSKSEDGTGFGYLVARGNNILVDHYGKLPDYCTVYQAELTAIQTAVECLLSEQTRNESIVILTDSQAALQQLLATTSKSKTATHCTEVLQRLGVRNEVKLFWIPGHKGYWGNEEADKLAKRGAKEGEPFKGYLPHSYLKARIKHNTQKVFTEQWATKAPRLSRLTINDDKIKEFLKLNRRKTRMAIQILSGHATLNYHLHKMKCVSSPTCPNCGDDKETVEHFIGVCPYYAQKRGEIFNEYYLTLTEITKQHSIRQILKFVEATKRLDEHNPP